MKNKFHEGKNMNNIQIERINILNNIISNIQNHEDENREFADYKELKLLLAQRNEAHKKTSSVIWQFVDKDIDAAKRYELELIDEEAKKHKLIVKDLDKKIKEIEIEILFFGGVNELHDLYEEFWESLEKKEEATNE